MSQGQHDELSQLFARNMNFSQPLPQHPATPDKQFFTQQPAQPQIIYSSQHYTGTYHLVPNEPVVQSRADSPLSMPVDDFEDTLRRNNVNPASLSPSQIKLFANADYEQRLRLVELWRISPPDNASHDSGAWSMTTLAEEEEMARLRSERRMNEQAQQNAYAETQEAEPYVLSGYANAQRADPVYAASAPGSWQPSDYTHTAQNYSHGAYQPAERTNNAQAHNNFDDDDMVM